MAKKPRKDLQAIHEYIWKRCVESDLSDTKGITDDQALETLEEYYSSHTLESNPEFFFYGFLLFELSFENAEKKQDYLARAKVILEKYRQVTGETDWEELEDRLEDINGLLTEMGILTKVEAAGERLLAPGASVENVMESQTKFAHIPDGMVLVPDGTFQAGLEGEEKFLPAFLIDRHAVTNRRYREFLQQAGYRKPKYWNDSRYNQDDQPVVGISVMDAKKYARWAGCELATSEQFEKAARGADGRLYPWGNDIKKDSADYGQDPETGKAMPVGSFPGNASPWGALDMAGTVWEWTNTSHPTAENSKVIRGGSWCDPERYLRTHEDLHASVREKADNLGFRTVKNHP